jgi:hypothetical protein
MGVNATINTKGLTLKGPMWGVDLSMTVSNVLKVLYIEEEYNHRSIDRKSEVDLAA